MAAWLKAFLTPATHGFKAPWRVFWVAFLVRVAYMTLAHTYRLPAYQGHIQLGYEAGRIAAAILHGYGYADPFSNVVLAHTGPTAWLPPLFPLLLTGVFRVFGVYTNLSAWVILAINCVFSASTAMAVWELGYRFAGRRCALWSGWLWALHPAAMQYAVKWVWEMTLTTFLFAWVMVLAFRMRESAQSGKLEGHKVLGRWLLFGLLWGLIALSNSTLLIFLPVCGLWILAGTGLQGKLLFRNIGYSVLAAVLFLAMLTPWTIRNYRVFHTFIPLRGNFGVELYLGNGPGSNGFLMEYDHPFQAPDQLRLYAQMGEVRYNAMRGELAKANIVRDPGHFLYDVMLRTYFFWMSVPHDVRKDWVSEDFRVLDFAFISLAGLFGLGLALRRGLPGAALFGWAFLLLPIPYYLVTVHARFRHPLEPLLCVLGVYLFQSTQSVPKNRSVELDQQVAAGELSQR